MQEPEPPQAASEIDAELFVFLLSLGPIIVAFSLSRLSHSNILVMLSLSLSLSLSALRNRNRCTLLIVVFICSLGHNKCRVWPAFAVGSLSLSLSAGRPSLSVLSSPSRNFSRHVSSPVIRQPTTCILLSVVSRRSLSLRTGCCVHFYQPSLSLSLGTPSCGILRTRN